MKLYLKVEHLLEEFPELRDSDRKLVWKVWCDENSVDKAQWIAEGLIYMHSFLKATGYDTISRARRMVQADRIDLRGSKWVQKQRKIKEGAKGTYVYREDYSGKLFN